MRDQAIQSQIDYYRARAGEYDQWWHREGRYERGEEATRAWRQEARKLEDALNAFHPAGAILEFAGGTGIWTEKLANHADDLTVVESAPETIAIAEHRVGPCRARFVEADIFQWTPDRRYDCVFFAFWLSHVPPDRFDVFWRLVDASLAEEGRVFVIDSLLAKTSSAANHETPDGDSHRHTRKLNDGREFEIYKTFHDPADLTKRLRSLGFEFHIGTTGQFFLHGHGQRTPRAPSRSLNVPS